MNRSTFFAGLGFVLLANPALGNLRPYSGPGLSMEMKPCQTVLVMPELDKHGRRKALNKRGFADTQWNETQLEFIARAKERAAVLKPVNGRYGKQPMVMEIGMAFADLALQIVLPDEEKKLPGAFYFGVDMDDQHVAISEARLSYAQVHSSQYQTFKAQLPIAEEDSETRAALASELENFYITDIGMFSVAMYFNPTELQQFMKWAFDLLPSGGRLYMTAVSPHANLYPGYEPTYFKRRDSLGEAFPGWIPNVKSLDMAPFVPDLASYLLKYPTFFHLLEPAVLKRVGEAAGFVDIKAKYLRRLFPENLVYRGSDPSVGELASFIGTKP